jgi:hypothetical protein
MRNSRSICQLQNFVEGLSRCINLPCLSPRTSETRHNSVQSSTGRTFFVMLIPAESLWKMFAKHISLRIIQDVSEIWGRILYSCFMDQNKKEKLHKKCVLGRSVFVVRPLYISEYEKGSFTCSSTRRTPRSHEVKDLYVKCTNVNVAVIILSSFDHSFCLKLF